MSEKQPSTGVSSLDHGADDVDRNWIQDVEHEETIAPEAVNEEEVEEFIEVDGIVDEHDMEQSVLLRGNEIIVPTTLRNGVEIFYAHVPTLGSEHNLNLPDLLSRVITFTNGSKMYLCFSKRCRKQIAFDGHIYNIDGFVKPANWNFWRCVNPSCRGAIRTSPNITELRVRECHSTTCTPDDAQIRLRITIYDLRLMAEFTDVPLDALYHAYLDKVATEHVDIVNFFPPFEVLKSNLEDHRGNLIYRKRFALEARESDTHAMSYDAYGSTMAKYKKTKPFPPSLCMSCSAEFRSTPEVPSQDQLLEHMFFDHNRKSAIISRFTFEDPGLFEQWDEHMYYLCINDDRHFKSNHGRSSLVDMHCTAFVRVHDWRLIIRREISEVVVDYCLDHFYHGDLADLEASKSGIDVFTPEVFMRDLAARRERTQQLIQDTGLQRIKRRAHPPSLTLNSSTKPKRMDATQIETSTHSNYPDGFGEQLQGRNYRSVEWMEKNESVFGSSKAQQRQKAVQQIVEGTSSTVANAYNYSKESYVSPYITKRENFANTEIYNSVLQFEMSCDMLKERMQYTRSIKAANHYLGRLTRILDDVMADPECAPSSANGCNVVDGNASCSSETNVPCTSSPPTTTEIRHHTRKSLFSPLKREAKIETKGDESLPLRQKVLVRKGENGQLVVVRRTILGKVRKMVRDEQCSSVSEEPIAEEAQSTPSGEAENPSPSNTTLEPCVTDPSTGDGPPIGDLLRDALYNSRTPRYARTLLQGVRRMAYQNLTEQNTPCADEEAGRFIRRISDHSTLRGKIDEQATARRTRGRPRKYP
ncbi:hypothetical protein RB195_006997 [Necator americanus]|uniref:FLYWCH zinc finger domain protein n=1 Tax=Necator americanus TaxID=51031 RepID=A0ABR1BY18_NECAM